MPAPTLPKLKIQHDPDPRKQTAEINRVLAKLEEYLRSQAVKK